MFSPDGKVMPHAHDWAGRLDPATLGTSVAVALLRQGARADRRHRPLSGPTGLGLRSALRERCPDGRAAALPRALGQAPPVCPRGRYTDLLLRGPLWTVAIDSRPCWWPFCGSCRGPRAVLGRASFEARPKSKVPQRPHVFRSKTGNGICQEVPGVALSARSTGKVAGILENQAKRKHQVPELRSR